VLPQRSAAIAETSRKCLLPERLARQRPELADFWDHRFREGTTPWDAGRAPALLYDFAARYESIDGNGLCPASGRRWRVLLPGCGSAWEAAVLSDRGWETTALDFSVAAIAAARATLGDGWQGTLLCADFFSFDPEVPFDVIYERAFLCALPRRLWADYASRMAELLRRGGLLAGFFFLGDETGGPPFAIRQERLHELLATNFSCREDRPVDDSLPIFAGQERWQVWERR